MSGDDGDEFMTEIFGNKLMTPNELAKSGLVSLVKQWQLRKSGELEFLRIGTRIRYTEAHIARFLERANVATANHDAVATGIHAVQTA